MFNRKDLEGIFPHLQKAYNRKGQIIPLDKRLVEMSKSSVYTYGKIKAVYNETKSYSATESLLILAMKIARCPLAIINDIKCWR